jgi:neutral amino acid transport system permease protein
VDWGSILDNALTAAFSLEAVVFALAAIGLNVHFGYTGLLNFGQAGFMAMGAYGVGISVTYYGWSLWVGLLMGIGASVVFALLLGLPTLRLRADYLAIVTIAAAEIVRLTMRSVTLREWSGGSNGLNGWAGEFYRVGARDWVLDRFSQLGLERSPGRYGLGPVDFGANRAWVLFVGWSVVAIVSLGLWILMRSPWGRILKGIREDEDAVRALGKNVFSYKMQSLILGGVIGSFGGMVWAIGNSTVQPDTYFTPTTFFAYVALILGGTARIFGPIVGSMIFWMVLSLTEGILIQAVRNDHIPFDLITGTQVGQVRFMLVGLALMLLMIFRPQGIFGDRRELALDR